MSRSKSRKTRAERAADLLSFYTVDELASSMNVTKGTVKNWIKGKTQPSDENFQKVQRREYYYKVERPVNVQHSKGIKGQAVIDDTSYEMFDLIRLTEQGEFDVSQFDKNNRVDFHITVVDQNNENNFLTETFLNSKKDKTSDSDFIGFLYRVFRSAADRYGGTNIGVFIERAVI